MFGFLQTLLQEFSLAFEVFLRCPALTFRSFSKNARNSRVLAINFALRIDHKVGTDSVVA